MSVRFATFSIVARDPASGWLGIGIASRPPCVGSHCPLIRPGLGAAVTQAWTNPYLSHRVMERLEQGAGAVEALDAVIAAETDAELRQVGVVDARGEAAAFTGAGTDPAGGHRIGEQVTVQGNMLADEAVLDAMHDAFVAARERPFPERLLAALVAGQGQGGDARGTRSANLRVLGEEVYPLMDLRIDWHEEPVAELERLYRVAERELFPFIGALPTRANPRGQFEAVRAQMSPPPRG